MKRVGSCGLGIACVVVLSSCAMVKHHHAEMSGRPEKWEVFRSDRVPWGPPPAGMPAGAKFAVLEGDPTKHAFFTMRAKLPAQYRIAPHWHPMPERLTVLSGALHLGMGETFDRKATRELPTGSYSAMPAEMRHFAWTDEETILQVSGIGPWQIFFVNPEDGSTKIEKKE